MSPKPDISEDRKNQILEAATNVFSEKGISSARMDDIASESGVSKGLLYWYFKSKGELVIAIAERFFNREMAAVKELAEREGSATILLQEFLEIMILDTRRIQPIMPLLFEFFALLIRKKGIHKVVGKVVSDMFTDLETIVARGIEQGEFIQLDPHAASVAIRAVIEGTYIIWAYAPDQVDIEKHIRSGVMLILQGMLV